MKKILATAAIALSLASPVLADDIDNRTNNLLSVYVYDGMCERLPPLLMEGIGLEIADVPLATRTTAEKQILDQLTSLGRVEFCARLKLRIDNFTVIPNQMDAPR